VLTLSLPGKRDILIDEIGNKMQNDLQVEVKHLKSFFE